MISEGPETLQYQAHADISLMTTIGGSRRHGQEEPPGSKLLSDDTRSFS
jgi:hypothetical protein